MREFMPDSGQHVLRHTPKMSKKISYKDNGQHLDSPGVTVTKPRAFAQAQCIPVWQELRGRSDRDNLTQDYLGTGNIGGYIKSKLGCGVEATSAPSLHQNQPTRRKRQSVTLLEARAKAEAMREKYLKMANEQLAKPYYDSNATMSASDAARLMSGAAKLLADLIGDITDLDKASLAKAAKQLRSREKRGYCCLQKIGKMRGPVLPKHATGYIPGEHHRSAVKTYQAMAYLAGKALGLITRLQTASTKKAA
jgi:hypothetical protein